MAHRVRVNFRKRLGSKYNCETLLSSFIHVHVHVFCCSLLDVIAESKALAEAGVELPEVVQQILTQVHILTHIHILYAYTYACTQLNVCCTGGEGEEV